MTFQKLAEEKYLNRLIVTPFGFLQCITDIIFNPTICGGKNAKNTCCKRLWKWKPVGTRPFFLLSGLCLPLLGALVGTIVNCHFVLSVAFHTVFTAPSLA